MLSAGVEQERPVAQGAATMEITVSRQDLLRELSATQSVVERKTTIPILSNFLLEAGQGEGDRGDGRGRGLKGAIFAYNHARWYVRDAQVSGGAGRVGLCRSPF